MLKRFLGVCAVATFTIIGLQADDNQSQQMPMETLKLKVEETQKDAPVQNLLAANEEEFDDEFNLIDEDESDAESVSGTLLSDCDGGKCTKKDKKVKKPKTSVGADSDEDEASNLLACKDCL